MDKINMNLFPDEPSNTAKIVLDGDLTIDSIADVGKEITALTDKYAALSFEVKNCEKLDLSGIQFFYAIQKKMKNNNKKISFSFQLEKKTEELLESTGFSELLNNNI